MQIVAVDTETDLIVPGRQAPRLTCVSIARDAAVGVELYHVVDDREELLKQLRLLLTTSDTAIVGHNFSFDAAVLCAEFPELVKPFFRAYYAGRILDTMLREQLIDICSTGFVKRGGKKYKPYSLETLTQTRLGVQLDKDSPWRLGYGPLRYTPLAQWAQGAIGYAKDDARYTLEVYKHQHAQADDYRAPGADYALVDELPQTRAAFALQLMSCWGVRTNKATIDAYEAELRPEFDALAKQLKADGVLVPKASKRQQEQGIDKGHRKAKKVVQAKVEAAFIEQGEDVPMTEKFQISTTRLTLKTSQDEVLARVARYTELEKLLQTYIPLARRGQDVPLNAGYRLLNSGRKQAIPNVQNQPRKGKTRGCYVARPGYVLCSVDYETAELRTLAAVCYENFGFSDMLDAFRRDEDLHLTFAAALLGMSYDEAKFHKKRDDVKDARQRAKAANFGFPGGMYPKRFIESQREQSEGEVNYSLAEATELRTMFLHKWSEMERWFQYGEEATLAGGGQADVTIPWSGRVAANRYRNDFLNYHFQGSVADIASEAAFALAYECYTGELYPDVGKDYTHATHSPLHESRLVLFLHDEIILEIPTQHGPQHTHAAAMRHAYVMREIAAKRVPIVPWKADPALMTKWVKGAEPKLDPQTNLLVPYDVAV